MNQFTYYGISKDLEKALKVHSQGGKVICHKCGAELLILNDWKSALNDGHGRRPGIYCPVNEKHVCSWFILSDRHDEVWRRFYERRKNK